jgi:uncharacterized protein (TIGR00730 family)
MRVLRRIGVFCGSSPGVTPAYAAAARELGGTLARRGLGLVYGGGAVGLMGHVAQAALEAGGEVTGVITRGLHERGLAHGGLGDLRVVGTMHERKALMADLADGFVALPGGVGTLEEFFEVLTWAQLGLHDKPCGLLDVAGHHAPLVRLLDHLVERGFLGPAHRAMILLEERPDALLERFARYAPPAADKAEQALRHGRIGDAAR